MHIDDKTAGHAYEALGDLADAFAVSIEAMTRIAIALQRKNPEPSIHVADPVAAHTLIRTMCADKD